MHVTTRNIFLITFILSSATFVLGADEAYDYRLLSTNRTSTMQKELNEAADAGYRIEKNFPQSAIRNPQSSGPCLRWRCFPLPMQRSFSPACLCRLTTRPRQCCATKS